MRREAKDPSFRGRRGERGARFSQALKEWLFASGITLAVVLALLPVAAPACAGDKPVAWKPIEQALLRVDDQPVKNWNVYEESKKGDPLLLAMGNRFLLIEIRDHKIFELPPAKVEHKGSDLLWDPAERPAEPLATTDWVIRDVGLAYRVGFRLEAEKHTFDVQLPHPMDLRYIVR
jgi:hypothetical protein